MSDAALFHSASSLSDKLGAAHVEARRDLDVTRRVTRGEPWYVVTDPVTLRAHRFTASDYSVLVALSVRQSLAETFASLVRAGRLGATDEERFYSFVVSLHAQGLLNLPITDETMLHRRHQAGLARPVTRTRGSLVSLSIPLCDPDAFLSRTLGLVRPLWSRAGFVVWLALACTAATLLVDHWSEFRLPLTAILADWNLPLLWLAFIASRALHELGRAYACKLHGGRVREAGITLNVLTPCTHADTSAAWTFDRKRDRMRVWLAGVYVELATASVAMIAWSTVSPGLVRTVLHDLILVVAATTVCFDLNPLMRGAAHDAFADWLGIPDLRERAQEHATRMLKRVFLGVRGEHTPVGFAHGLFLLAFSIASHSSQAALALGIAAVIAAKSVAAGVLVGAAYCGHALYDMLRGLIPYLWRSRETARVQFRARALGWLVMLGAPLALLAIPIRTSVRAPGVVRARDEVVVRAEAPGFVNEVGVRAGESVEPGRSLVELDDPKLHLRLAEVDSRLEAGRLRRSQHLATDLSKVREEDARASGLEHERALRESELASTSVRSPARGMVIDGLQPADVGRYVERGEALATVAGSTLVVRACLTEQQLADAQPHTGQHVEFRSRSDPGRRWPGRIERIAHDPGAPENARCRFEVEVTLDESADLDARILGATGELLLGGRSEPVGLRTWRAALALAGRSLP